MKAITAQVLIRSLSICILRELSKNYSNSNHNNSYILPELPKTTSKVHTLRELLFINQDNIMITIIIQLSFRV